MGRLRAALRIRPGEERVAFRLLLLMLVGMTGAAIGANGVEGLFFSRFGPDFLPFLYVFLGPLTFAVMIGMSTLLTREATRFLVALPLALAVALVAARVVLLLDLHWFYPVLWLVMMVLWTSQVMGSWGLAGAVSDTRQAKRLFPLYGAGLIAGGVIGGLATGPLADLLGTENLLLVWIGALGVMFLLARQIVGTPASAARRRRSGRRRVAVVRQLSEGFRDVWTWPLLRWMSVSLVLFAILYFTLALLFAESATARFPRTEDLAGFLGLFMGLSNGVALLVSLLVANRLFARFGLPAMVLALATIYLAGYGILAFATSFAALVAFRFVQMVWVNGVWATGWQALFNVVPEERRARTRLFMDGGPLQTGIVLSGVLLILADRVLGQRQLYVVGAATAALAIWSMWRARRAYGGALVAALRTGNPDVFRPDEEPFGGFRHDADALAAVTAGATDPDPAVRRVSMEILADLSEPDSASAAETALADPDAQVRAAAVRALARAGVSLPAEMADRLLDDPDPEARAGAAAALWSSSPERAAGTLVTMSEDPRSEWRAASLEAMGRAGYASDRLSAGLDDPEPSVRRAAAGALASFDPAVATEPLVRALADADPAVRDAAAAALARIGASAEPELVAALSRPDTEVGALLALSEIPGAPPAELRAYAEGQVVEAARYHRLWLWARSDRDPRLDLLAHALRDRAVGHGLKAIRAAGRLGDHAAIDVAIENLASRDPQQRANALEMLEAVGEPELVRPLLPMWEAPAATASDGSGATAEVMRDPDPWLRACAALAAGALDRAALASTLEELARSDPDPLVREAATTTLKGGRVETLSTLSLLERVLFLRKVRLFADLTPADLKHVAEVASEHAFPDGEVIAQQGEAGDEMHIVVSGEIKVLVGHDDGPTSEVARRASGEYVGEMAILSEESRMASLVCAGSVRTLSLDRRSFERILRERPDAALAVMRELSDRLRQAHASGPLH
jgi:HEAT repeat protein